MSLFARLESKLAPYAVPNLTLVLIAGQVASYIAGTVQQAQGRGDILEGLRLSPSKVIAGEYWRLITYVFDPPIGQFLLFALIFWYLFYLFGTTLEATWGAFRYNLFLAIGYLASVGSTFLIAVFDDMPGEVYASNAYLYGSIFLAFARLHPDFVLNLFFILPVKIKWLALLQWLFYGYRFITGLAIGDWLLCLTVVAAVLNYLLFFGRDIWRDIKHGHRRRQYQSRTLKASQRLTHSCRVCGLSSDDSPRTQFRYCSQCEGQCCYCPDHIRDHEHIVKQKA